MKWPKIREIILYTQLGTLVLIVFLIIYGGCNWLASQRTDLWHFYFPWEAQISFVPELIYIYFSLNLLLWMPIFFLNEIEIRNFSKSLIYATLVAGVIFLIFPTQLGFSRSEKTQELFQFLYQLDRPHNLFPSLHITYSGLTVLSLLPKIKQSKGIQAFFGSWFFLICVSVILVHQHHVMDILGGMTLAWWVQPVHSSRVHGQ